MTVDWEPTKIEVTLDFEVDLGPGDETIVARNIVQKMFDGDPWFGLSIPLDKFSVSINDTVMMTKELIDA